MQSSRSASTRLRTELLTALAPFLLVSSTGCIVVEVGDEEAGVTTNANGEAMTEEEESTSADGTSGADTGTSTSTGGTTMGGTSTGGTTMGGTSTGGTTMASTSTTDTTDTTDTGEPAECGTIFPGDEATLDEGPECDLSLDNYELPVVFTTCLEAEPGADCAQVCEPHPTCGELWSCPDVPFAEWYDSCPPYFDERKGMCCTVVVGETGFFGTGEGRPFCPDGAVRVASTSAGLGWSSSRGRAASSPSRSPVSLGADERARLGEHWRRVALAEHASVASFARFVAQLQALGAPPALVRDALGAAGDEVRHARIAFGLASRYADAPVSAGPLDTGGGLAGVLDFGRAVRDAFVEGCVAETLSAHEIERAAEQCSEPEVADALVDIAADERRHAALAWRFVAWAVDQRPELRAELAALSRELCESAKAGSERQNSRPQSSTEARLLAHGCPSRVLRMQWRAQGMAEVVQPCAAALLG